MNQKPRPSKTKKGATVGVVVCFLAAIAIVGTYTLRDYQEAKRQMTEAEEERKTKEENSEETANPLVINTVDEDELKEDEKEAAKNASGETSDAEDTNETSDDTDRAGSGNGNAGSTGDAARQTAGNAAALNFTEESQLLWPVEGSLLMNYSMDKTVYFSTLDQFKYNPALVIAGAEGEQVLCGTTGVVKSIDVTAETGTTVNVDIGNGYELFYGQLKEVPVSVGDYVEAKTVLGYVSQPTKYYSVEGCNVYFEMRRDGAPVNPVEYMS